MEKRLKLFLTFMFIIVLVMGIYLFTNWFSIITGYFGGEDEKVRLAKCLNNLGTEFYASVYCPDCEKQQQLFGKAFEVIKKVDCGNNKENCPNVREVPAWYIDKQIYYGFKTLNELKEISGCKSK